MIASAVVPATDRAAKYSVTDTPYLRKFVCTAESDVRMLGTETSRVERTFNNAVAPQLDARDCENALGLASFSDQVKASRGAYMPVCLQLEAQYFLSQNGYGE